MRQTILVTGFGAFPGARQNPTATLLRRLERHESRLSRLGISLRCTLLPVAYAEIGPTVEAAVAASRPDAILHLGLASRRRHISVETRALNRAGPLHPDATRRRPAAQVLAAGGAGVLKATYPAVAIHAALRRAGHAAELSINAGDYVCNATLYASLRAERVARVGFIHVPRVRRPGSRTAIRPTIEELTRVVLCAVMVMARDHRPLRGGGSRALRRL